MWLFDAFNVIQTNTPIFISESNLLTFYLLYPFLLPFRSFPSYFCLLSIVATSLFPASVSLACLTSFSFPPHPVPFFLSGPNFLVELARKRLLRRLPFLLFLRSWRSFCDETVIFAKRLLTILQTSIADPLLFQNVPRANDLTIWRRLLLLIPSLSLSISSFTPLASFCPLLSLRFAFAAKYYFFVAIPNAARPFGMSSLSIHCVSYLF